MIAILFTLASANFSFASPESAFERLSYESSKSSSDNQFIIFATYLNELSRDSLKPSSTAKCYSTLRSGVASEAACLPQGIFARFGGGTGGVE